MTTKEDRQHKSHANSYLESHYQILRDFMYAGSLASASRTAFAPLVRVQILLQTQRSNTQILSGQVKPYTGIIDCFYRVHKEQGFLSFWRGNGAAVLRVFPSQALAFGLNDFFKDSLDQVDKQVNLQQYILQRTAIGMVSGALTTLACHPMELIHTQMSSDAGSKGTRRYNSMTECLKHLYKVGGGRIFYTALVPSMFGAGIYRAVSFGLFDVVKVKVLNDDPQTFTLIQSATKLFTAIPLSLLAGFICYPIHTVTRKLMIQSGTPKLLYNGFWDCWQHTVKKYGVRGLYSGLGASVSQLAGSASIIWMYDEVRRIDKMSQQRQ